MSEHNSKMTQSDKDWLDLLNGKTVTDAPQDMQACSEALRQSVLARHREAMQSVSGTELRRGRERLLFRLQREGLLKKRSFSVSAIAGLAVAASLALMLMTQPMQDHYLPGPVTPPDSGQRVIKEFTPPQVVYTANPDKEAKRLVRELAKMGLDVEQVHEQDSVILIIQLNSHPAGLENFCHRLEISCPASATTLVLEVLTK